MARIAFLGLGAMGSRMAQRLLQAGHAVTVWNRSPAATAPLVAAGALAAATPRAAVAGAEFVFSMVRDDEAARHVWLDERDGAVTALPAGALAIECSTLSVEGARTLAGALAAHGHRLLEAPVSARCRRWRPASWSSCPVATRRTWNAPHRCWPHSAAWRRCSARWVRARWPSC